MIKNQQFKRHYSRLVLEAVIKSVLFGLLIGFAADFVAAVFAWVFAFGGIWFPISVGAGVAALSGVLLYFVRFKPDVKETARRVDRLGLEERMITMLELEGDDSYIATLQRENAKAHLSDVEGRKFKLRFSKALMILTAVAMVLGSSMTTVVALAENNVIPSGPDIINPDDPFESFISVSYVADEGGIIEGETDQLIAPGADAEPVIAEAEDGWVFVGWDDGLENPARLDTNITADVVYTAIFQEIGEGGDGEDSEEGPSEGGNEGDKAEDLPADGGSSAESDQQGGNGDKGDGQGSSGESDGAQGEGEEKGEGGKGDGKGQGAGGKWQESNQFIDGNTYYKDQLDLYYEWAQEIFAENGEIPPELLEFFETYYNSI